MCDTISHYEHDTIECRKKISVVFISFCYIQWYHLVTSASKMIFFIHIVIWILASTVIIESPKSVFLINSLLCFLLFKRGLFICMGNFKHTQKDCKLLNHEVGEMWILWKYNSYSYHWHFEVRKSAISGVEFSKSRVTSSFQFSVLEHPSSIWS